MLIIKNTNINFVYIEKIDKNELKLIISFDDLII